MPKFGDNPGYKNINNMTKTIDIKTNYEKLPLCE